MPTVKPHPPLPTEAKGDQSIDAIWLAVGCALSAWEELQRNLTHLFVEIVNSDSYGLMRAFGTSTVVVSKLEMTLYAATFELVSNQQLLEQLTAILNRVRGFNDRRNDIAHGCALGSFDDKDEMIGFFLKPLYTMSKKYKDDLGEELPPPEYCWTSAQIHKYAEAFTELSASVTLFRDALRNWRKTLLKKPDATSAE